MEYSGLGWVIPGFGVCQDYRLGFPFMLTRHEHVLVGSLLPSMAAEVSLKGKPSLPARLQSLLLLKAVG